jgi:hypothetical protein
MWPEGEIAALQVADGHTKVFLASSVHSAILTHENATSVIQGNESKKKRDLRPHPDANSGLAARA